MAVQYNRHTGAGGAPRGETHVFNRIKRLFGHGASGKPAADTDAAQPRWIDAADNPWRVPVLDVRPVTLTMISTSTSRSCAANAVSYGREDGSSFVGQSPPTKRTVPASLRYRIDRMLADGVLFIPEAMEQKWAIFARGNKIICVRSWLREVHVTADVRIVDPEHAEITSVTGVFAADDEPADFTARTLDYLLRTHVLEQEYPVPLLGDTGSDPKTTAIACMSSFGNMAHFATPHALPNRAVPERPLRTVSLLHLAVVRNDTAAAAAALDAGIPIDIRAYDGLPPMHWALIPEGTEMLAFLLSRGGGVDARGEQGSTPLMSAVQQRKDATARFLLDHGADANATDARGFTALHRAAEMGQLEIARLLLERGATRDVAAEGHTPLSLAKMRNEAAMVELLS
jgi:hypothetical protein